MMVWQLTSTMVRGAMHDACPPFTGHQRDQLTRQMLTRQMVPEMQCDGRLARWPARGFALGTTPIATRGITSDPVHRSTTQLDVRLRQRGFACSRAIIFGPADCHSYTATGLSGGHDYRKIPGLGGSLHQFWF
jgi:hypothetical protein